MMSFNELVDASTVIINGYALQKIEKGIRVINVHKPTHVSVISEKDEVVETNMDDVELHVAKICYAKGLPYMEDDDAEVL